MTSIWNIRMVLMMFLVSRNVSVYTHKTDERPKRAQELQYIPLQTGNKGMVDLSLNHIKHNLFIGVKWQRMWCSELASCVWLNVLPSYGMSSVCDLGPAKVKSRLTSVCTSGISEPTLQWGLISIMSLHLQSQNRPPNTKLLKPYTSVCSTIFVVAVWWLVSVWD